MKKTRCFPFGTHAYKMKKTGLRIDSMSQLDEQPGTGNAKKAFKSGISKSRGKQPRSPDHNDTRILPVPCPGPARRSGARHLIGQVPLIPGRGISRKRGRERCFPLRSLPGEVVERSCGEKMGFDTETIFSSPEAYSSLWGLTSAMPEGNTN